MPSFPKEPQHRTPGGFRPLWGGSSYAWNEPYQTSRPQPKLPTVVGISFGKFMPRNRFSEIRCRDPRSLQICQGPFYKVPQMQLMYLGYKPCTDRLWQNSHFIFTEIYAENKNWTSVHSLLVWGGLGDLGYFNFLFRFMLGTSHEMSYQSSFGQKHAEVGPLPQYVQFLRLGTLCTREHCAMWGAGSGGWPQSRLGKSP